MSDNDTFHIPAEFIAPATPEAAGVDENGRALSAGHIVVSGESGPVATDTLKAEGVATVYRDEGIEKLEQHANETALIDEGIAKLEDHANRIDSSRLEQQIVGIGQVGDWMVQMREQRISMNGTEDVGLQSLWRRISGQKTTVRTLMQQEAALSRQIFKDKRSSIFFFDRIGEGHGEWVVQKAPEDSKSEPETVYYEVSAEQGTVLVKTINAPYRSATPGEVSLLNAAVSSYYKLMKSQLYKAD